MSHSVAISVIYAIGSLIIILIFTALLQNLLCAQHRPSPKGTNNRHHRASTTSDEAHRHRTHSLSFVTNNNPNITTENSVTNTASPSAITTSNASRTRSRSSSFSFSRRTSLPHAVSYLVSSMKSMLYQMEHRGHQSNEIQLVVRCAFIFSCFGFLIFSSMLCIYFTVESVTKNDPLYDTHHDLKFIAVLFYTMGKYALYIGSSARLYYSLEGGVFQYNVSVYIILITYFVVHLAIATIAIALFYIHSYVLCAVCVVIFYLMDALYLILLYTLFTKQLLKVIGNTAAYISSSTASSSSSSPTSSINEPVQLQITSAQTEKRASASFDAKKSTKQKAYIGKHQISAMEYVTKHSVLVFCSVLSSIAMSVVIGLLCVVFIQQFDDRLVIHIMWCVDCVVNSSAIYLNFIFGSWAYKHLCGVCHRTASTMCDKWTSKKVPDVSTDIL